MPRHSRLITSIVPAILAGTLACAPSAGAATRPPMTVGVRNASRFAGNYFQLSALPNQTVPAGSLKVRNRTTSAATVILDPVSGLTASTLGSAYGSRGTAARGPASWLVLGQRRVTLPPKAQVRVPVSVRMGSGVPAGDYLAGVSVQAAGPSDVQVHGNVAIASAQRYAIGVLVRVPGPRHPLLQVTGVRLDTEPAGVTFFVLARNSGNAILQNVRGVATISSGSKLIARRQLGPGTFVTGTSIAYPLLVRGLRPNLGAAYHVRAVLRYSGGVAQINKMVSFGQIDAIRQQAYGGPAVKLGGGSDRVPLLLLVIAAVAGGLLTLVVRHRRSGERALRRALPREIAHARANSKSLSVILVSTDGKRSRTLASGMGRYLGDTDRFFKVNGSGLMVVSPGTAPQAGETLAVQIRRHLASRGVGAAVVVPVTSAAESSVEELLQAAAAGAEGSARHTRTGRGDGDGTHAAR